jgi:hypothetical protein
MAVETAVFHQDGEGPDSPAQAPTATMSAMLAALEARDSSVPAAAVVDQVKALVSVTADSSGSSLCAVAPLGQGGAGGPGLLAAPTPGPDCGYAISSCPSSEGGGADSDVERSQAGCQRLLPQVASSLTVGLVGTGEPHVGGISRSTCSCPITGSTHACGAPSRPAQAAPLEVPPRWGRLSYACLTCAPCTTSFGNFCVQICGVRGGCRFVSHFTFTLIGWVSTFDWTGRAAPVAAEALAPDVLTATASATIIPDKSRMSSPDPRPLYRQLRRFTACPVEGGTVSIKVR